MEIPSPATFLLVWIHFFFFGQLLFPSFFFSSFPSFFWILMLQLELGLAKWWKLYHWAAFSAPSNDKFFFASASWEFCPRLLVPSALSYNLGLDLGENVDPGVCQHGFVSCPYHLYTPSFPLSLLCNLNEVMYRNGWALCEKLKIL